MQIKGIDEETEYSCTPKSREEKECLFKVQMVKQSTA
jgi:hypothetical protein